MQEYLASVGVIGVVFGILILIFPKVLHYLVGVFLILLGVISLVTSAAELYW